MHSDRAHLDWMGIENDKYLYLYMVFDEFGLVNLYEVDFTNTKDDKTSSQKGLDVKGDMQTDGQCIASVIDMDPMFGRFHSFSLPVQQSHLRIMLIAVLNILAMTMWLQKVTHTHQGFALVLNSVSVSFPIKIPTSQTRIHLLFKNVRSLTIMSTAQHTTETCKRTRRRGIITEVQKRWRP